jgi:hypothetical protein
MTFNKSNKGRWFIKHNDKVRGPFPNQLISSNLILGRINLNTLISQDEKNWSPVKDYKALVPDVVLNAHSPEGAKALMLARVREDERRSTTDEQESDDRRVDEDQIIKLHRQLRDDVLKRYHNKPQNKTRNIAIILAIVAAFLLAFLFYQPSIKRVGADCDLAASPGVNWSSCNKQGQNLAGLDLSSSQFKATQLNGADFSRSRLDHSDLSYASLFHAEMQQSSLQSAQLKGTNLRQANLQGANLQDADLSYAELVGAKLDGAVLINTRFDNAIWINGQQCLPGSVGACLLSSK